MTPDAISPDELTGKAFAAVKYPVCPHCGADPARIAGVVTKMGGGLCVVFFCEADECRKIHGVSPLTPEPPPPPGPPVQKPGIWLPNGRM